MRRLLLLVAMMCLTVSGLYAENYPYRSDYLFVTVSDHADWLYQTGEKAVVDVQLYKYGVPQDCTVIYEIADDMMAADSKGSVKMKQGRARVDMGTRKVPGFRDLRLKAVVGGKTYSHHIKVGFSVDGITPFTQEPKDFTDFRKQNLDEMRETPLKYTKTKAEEYCTDKIDCYLLNIRVSLV